MSNEQQFNELKGRVEALEKLAGATADEVAALAKKGPAPVKQSHPLHPSRIGTPAYAEHVSKLRKVLPGSDGYEKAQAELREAGIIV